MHRDTILIVDGDVAALRTLGEWLAAEGHEVARELDDASALSAAARLDPQVAIVDLGAGTSLVEQLAGQGISVIGLSADASPAARRDGLRRGAVDVVARPVDQELLTAVVALAAARARDRRRITWLERQATGDVRAELLGSHGAMRSVAQQVAALAQSDRTAVLLSGPPGSGRTWTARLIHQTSARSTEPFRACAPAAHDPRSLEAVLFGVERGVAAGVNRRRRGLMEVAGRGTLLLREIGNLPLELQPLVLRAMESRTLRRLGGEEDIEFGARLMATTSEDLDRAVEEGRFREDLRDRLTAQVLVLPPLREWSEGDRRGLVQALYDRLAERMATTPPTLSPEAMDRLISHDWPGNVAELAHVLERAATVGRDQLAILVEHLPGELRARPGLGDRRHNPVSLDEVEKRQIESALRFHGGNRTRAARELRISRATLINKIKRYAITD